MTLVIKPGTTKIIISFSSSVILIIIKKNRKIVKNSKMSLLYHLKSVAQNNESLLSGPQKYKNLKYKKKIIK